LIIVDYRTDKLGYIRSYLSPIVHPIIKLVDTPSQISQWVSSLLQSSSDILEENIAIKRDSTLLRAKLLKYEALEKENTRLRAVLASSFELGEQFIVASLINVNLDPNSHRIIADKGSRFNLFKGQAVINTKGIIGQITRVLPFSSEVMLITDLNHAIPIEINRTGLRTIAVGTGVFNQLTLPYLPRNTDIKPGDLLTTSGLGGRYPKGYPVATISTLSTSPGQAFIEARAQTAVQTEHIHELLMVWSDKQPIPLIPVLEQQPTKASINQTETATEPE